MSSHKTMRACPLFTLSHTSAAKCSMASSSKADLCGPLLIAACIPASFQSRPVHIGQPNLSQSVSKAAALCCKAKPWGAISDLSDVLWRSSQWSCGKILLPWCVIYCVATGCQSSASMQWCLFCFRSILVVAPVAIEPVASITGGRRR